MGRIKRTKEQIKIDIDEQRKDCCVCGIRKPFNLFYNYRNKSDGKSYRCKECDDIARHNWKNRNPDSSYISMRSRNLKFRFGITINDYQMMLEKQNFRCAICGATENSTTGNRTDWNFSVDHCHSSGKVRGLLCNNCNRGIGLLKDSSILLRKAAEYLETH